MRAREKWSAAGIAFLLLACFVPAAYAGDFEHGRILQYLPMESGILGRTVHYSVYLPPGYDTDAGRTYPVFYLLHGGGGPRHFGSAEWIHHGEIDYIMNRGIADRSITPMIVVMPDGRRNKDNWPLTMFMNDVDGEYMWADMFVKELIPFVEKEYRVNDQRTVRGIGGLSMGGYGAIFHTLQNPDMFLATVMISAGLNMPDQIVSFDQDYIERRFAKPFGMSGQAGKDRLNEHFYRLDPFEAAKRMDAGQLGKLHIYMDVGSQDRRQRGNFEFHWFLWEAGVDHVYVQRSGEHVWTYFREGMAKGLEYASGFLRPDY